MKTFITVVLGLVFLGACGEDAAVPRDVTPTYHSHAGPWQATFANGKGTVKLSEATPGKLNGTLTIEAATWPVTGVTAAQTFTLVITPTENGAALFTAVGLASPVTDRTELFVAVDAKFTRGFGTARSSTGATEKFSLNR